MQHKGVLASEAGGVSINSELPLHPLVEALREFPKPCIIRRSPLQPCPLDRLRDVFRRNPDNDVSSIALREPDEFRTERLVDGLVSELGQERGAGARCSGGSDLSFSIRASTAWAFIVRLLQCGEG
jgi:hypothetical protein